MSYVNIISQKRSDAIRSYLKLVSTPEDEDKVKDFKNIKDIYPNISFSYDQIEHINGEVIYRMTMDEILKNISDNRRYKFNKIRFKKTLLNKYKS
jgi:hypothetical protein